MKIDQGDFVQLPAKWLVCAVDLTGLTADEALNRLLAAHELHDPALAFVEKDVERHNDLQQRLKESSSLQEDEEIYQAMSQLEQDDKYIAYKSKGKAQHSYVLSGPIQ